MKFNKIESNWDDHLCKNWNSTYKFKPAQRKFLSEPGNLIRFRPGTQNPLEPSFWVPTLNSEPTSAEFAWNPEPTRTHSFEIRVGSTRNPGTHFRTCPPLVQTLKFIKVRGLVITGCDKVP